MTPRLWLADALGAYLGSPYRVIPVMRQLERIEVDTLAVLVLRTEITPADGLGHGFVSNELRVWMVTPATDPDIAEDALDEGLQGIVDALDSIPAIQWENATRGALDDRFHGWQFTVTIASEGA